MNSLRARYTKTNVETRRLDIATASSARRVLIVDDSQTVRKIFAMHLGANYECREACSFDEAVAALKELQFDVVITDVIMPGLSGIELLRKIIKEYPETAVVVVSAVDRPQRALDAIRLGAFDYLIKPCEPSALEFTVERAIERRDLLANARRHEEELERQNAELLRRRELLEHLQAQVVQSEKMASLGQLAAGVAHELNNPVGIVFANIEMLGDLIEQVIEGPDQALIDEIRSIIDDCREGSTRIRDIVQNLRTFSRLDEAEYKETDIHEGIDATLRLLSRHFATGPITIRKEFGDLPRVNAFPSQLNQVWMNLLANAAQAIGNRAGEIFIRTWTDENDAIVTVSDTGTGIPVQHLNRIFDPFFTTKPVGDGTGLGLSISFGIIERHGGRITAKSRLNEGTTFEVRLPKQFTPDLSSIEKSITFYHELEDQHDLQITTYR